MFWFKLKKKHTYGRGVINLGKTIVYALDKREANQKLETLFRGWPLQNEGFCYFSPTLYGPYKTKKEAEDATIIE